MKKLMVLFICALLPMQAWAISIPFKTDKTGFTEGTDGVQILGACVNDTRGGAIAEDNVGCLRITGQGDLHMSPYDSGGTSATDTTAHAVKTLSVDTTGTAIVPSTVVTDAATISRGQSNVLLGDVAMFADNGANYERIGSASGRLNVNASQNGTWTTDRTGITPVRASALSTTVTTVSASAAKWDYYHCMNPSAATAYVQVFDVSGAVTLGTTAPTLSVPLPAGAAGNLANMNLAFANAIKVAATTTATGSTAPATALDCNFGYR